MKKANTTVFDLDSIAELPSADVEILHPISRQPTGGVVTLMGPEHPERKRIGFALQKKFRNQISKKGRIDSGDPEDEAAEETARLAKFTVGWRNIGRHGQALEFSPAAALELYSAPEMAWLRRQLMAALGDQENFIKGSEPN